MKMIHDNQSLLIWLGGVLIAGFVFAAIGGWVGRAGIILTTAGGFIGAFGAVTEGQSINLPWTKNVTPTGADKIAMSAAVIGLLGLVLCFGKVPRWVGLIFALLVPAVVVGATRWPHGGEGMSISADALDHCLAMGRWHGLVAGLLWLSTESIAVKQKGIAPVWVTGLFAMGVAGLLANMAELRQATFAAIPSMAILGAFLGGLCGKRPVFDRGLIFVWIALLTILLGYGMSDSSERLPLFVAIVCAAPLLGWIGQMKPVSKWRPWKRELVRGLFVSAPILTVLVIASLRSKKAAEATPAVTPDNPGGWTY